MQIVGFPMQRLNYEDKTLVLGLIQKTGETGIEPTALTYNAGGFTITQWIPGFLMSILWGKSWEKL